MHNHRQLPMVHVRHYQTQNLAYTMVMKVTECLSLINTNVVVRVSNGYDVNTNQYFRHY